MLRAFLFLRGTEARGDRLLDLKDERESDEFPGAIGFGISAVGDASTGGLAGVGRSGV